MKKILIAEDDTNLGMVLSSYLTLKGFATTLCEDGEVAYNEFLKGGYDLCLVDIMIPIRDGYSLVENIRKIDMDVPIFFMSARSMQEDILKGFSLNADDYITKPFSMEELLMRIKAVFRRMSYEVNEEKQVFQIGEYTFDNNVQQLIFRDEVIKLTSKESALLYVLCEKMGKVIREIKNIEWEHGKQITVSCGMSTYTKGLPYSKFLGDADDKLYKAKKNGRNRIEYNS